MAGVLAAQLGVRRRVAVRISDRIAVPVTAGWIRPVILLPSECDGWAGSRRRMVLIHELSHVARGDVLWQIAAKLACVIYWPHPMVWFAARRMRVEREAACDDAVLRDVERPSEYASLLLDVAASLADRPIGMSTAAIAMACGRSVEERIRWIVQPGRCRLPIGRRTARWFSVAAILLVLGLGSISIFAGSPAPAASAVASELPIGAEKQNRQRAGKEAGCTEAGQRGSGFVTNNPADVFRISQATGLGSRPRTSHFMTVTHGSTPREVSGSTPIAKRLRLRRKSVGSGSSQYDSHTDWTR